MTLRYMSGASIVTLLTCGLATVAPAHAQNTTLLPAGEHALMTVTGCLQPTERSSRHFILSGPRLGPVANVPSASCDAPVDAQALRLNDGRDHGINDTMIGRWIEVNGRLEKEESTDPSNRRELRVRSFRLVPVVPPRVEVAVVPIPPRAEAPAPAPAPIPVATTLIVEEALPKTASPLALIGLFGLITAAGGLGFRYYRSHVRG